MKTLHAILVVTALLAAMAAVGGAVSVSAEAKTARKEQIVKLTVTPEGFEPAIVKVRAGRPVKLIVTRKTKATCATDIVIHGYGVRKALPLDRPVEVVFTPKKIGTIRYACAMDMIAGRIVVD